MTSITPTDFQQASLGFRTTCHVGDFGARGGGKSFLLCLDCIAHCSDFGAEARPIVCRESWSGLQQLQDQLYDLCVVAFGSTTTINKSEGLIRLPTGGIITLKNLADENSYRSIQGKSFSAAYFDEAGNAPLSAWALFKKLRSNLRVAPGRRAHIRINGNPFGAAHGYIVKNFISKSPGWWKPYREDETNDLWVLTTSSFRENPHINQAAYERQLLAATANSPRMRAAWMDGDWTVALGAIFDCFDPGFHVREAPKYARWRYRVGADWGTASVAAACLLGELMDPTGPYKAGDLFILDETDTAIDEELNLGSGISPSEFAEQIIEMLRRNRARVRTEVYCDDARGLAGDTVVGILNESGLDAYKPDKGPGSRTGGWNKMRELFHAAKAGTGRALFVTPSCPHLISMLVQAPRGILKPEDVSPDFPDHHLDMARYAVMAEGVGQPQNSRVLGAW